jgi:ribonuclease P protein component
MRRSVTMAFQFLRSSYEANISTQPHQASSETWFPRPHENSQWQKRPQETPRQGSQAPNCQGFRQVIPLTEKKSLPLSPRHRLRHGWEYKRFFTNSEVLRLSECVIFRIQNELGHFRLGITLKARGTSVQRNRVKRRVREAFRQQGPVLGGYDYNVVIPKTKKLAHPYPEKLAACLKAELVHALRGR